MSKNSIKETKKLYSLVLDRSWFISIAFLFVFKSFHLFVVVSNPVDET